MSELNLTFSFEMVQDIAMMAGLLSSSSKSPHVVEYIDRTLNGEWSSLYARDDDTRWSIMSMMSAFSMDVIRQSLVDEVECRPNEDQKRNLNVDHSLKYTQINSWKASLKTIARIRASPGYEHRMDSQLALQSVRWKRAIKKMEDAINNNESDEDVLDNVDEFVSDKHDLHGWPDALAKRLLFERGLMPWDEGADAALIELCNW